MSDKRTPQEYAMLTISILAKIKLHKISNPVSAENLANEFSISERKVREIVRLLRRQGEAIASAGGNLDGYFIAENYAQLERTIEVLKAHEDDTRFTRIQMMKKFNMHEGLWA